MISNCRIGHSANAKIPHSTSVMAAGITEWLVWLKAAKTTTTASAIPTRDGSKRLSASRPPSMLPAVKPTPNNNSMMVTPWGLTPVMSCRIGAM
ncbi:hypothetical protein D3C76_1229270 [compost metagenome]